MTCTLLHYINIYIIIVSNTLLRINSISWKMKYIVYVLAIVAMASGSCKSKSEPVIAKEPEIIKEVEKEKEVIRENEGGNHHHHKRMPPGHEKKLHGDQSARKYAPGHRNKH